MKVKINYGLEVKEQWNKVWEDDSIERNQSKLDYPEYWELYDKYIPKDGKLLEAGVGLGKWLNYFQKKDYDIVGIDYKIHFQTQLQFLFLYKLFLDYPIKINKHHYF